MRGSRLNCNVCRIQVVYMEIFLTMQNVKSVEFGKKEKLSEIKNNEHEI
jgi:hypothetical protein